MFIKMFLKGACPIFEWMAILFQCLCRGFVSGVCGCESTIRFSE